MTGGTLTVDKSIESDKPLDIHTYTLHLFEKPSDSEYDAFHAGIHTNEHLLAYTPDTGSLRASLADIVPDLDTKMILDVSPFETEDGNYGFRITSLIELDTETLRQATKISLQRAIEYIGKIQTGQGDKKWYKGVPFATAEQCGQFTYHNPEKAGKDLGKVNVDTLLIESDTISTNHQKAAVCDLRLLKPKNNEADDRITLDPKFSYYLSQKIEHELPEKMIGTATIVWTFGCMTGTYLCVSYLNSMEEDIPHVHAKIMEILTEIGQENLTPEHRTQLETILANYEAYGVR